MELSPDAQLRYVTKWFQEWSELQRSDFVPILASKLNDATYVNGITNHLSGLNCTKPVSLFECQIKLFREWYQQWDAEHRDNFVKQIGDIDPTFMDRLKEDIPTNGYANGFDNELYEEPALAENEV